LAAHLAQAPIVNLRAVTVGGTPRRRRAHPAVR
jgi:hypothetical protein